MLSDTSLGEDAREEITVVSRFTGREAMAAAEIVADADYDPLGIERGFNCLYVFLPDHFDWHALMVPTGEVEQDCSEVVLNPEELQGQRLVVGTTGEGHNFTHDDFPKVARWDWDSIRTQQYIGLKCGATWCEVGEEDFVPSKDRAERCEGDGDEIWRARIVNADGNQAFKCIRRCDMSEEDFEVPGTARWRWLKGDEGAWMRCLQGCCELH